MIKLELRNRIRSAYPHVKARLHKVADHHPSLNLPRWRIRIEGASHSDEIHQINTWAKSANILPHHDELTVNE